MKKIRNRMRCPRCSHEWKPSVKYPSKCPACSARLLVYSLKDKAFKFIGVRI